MRDRSWTGSWSCALLGTAWLISLGLQAATPGSDGYTLDDLELHQAYDLYDVCTIEAGHDDYDVAMAFCYGFFEGATHYDDALAGSPDYVDIVCSPANTTRNQAVTVFVQYMRDNPEYGAGPPIDAVFRSMVAKWPCIE